MHIVGMGRPRMLRFVLVTVGVYDALYLAIWFVRGESPRFGDFFGLWSFGTFALLEPTATIYDAGVLQDLQRSLDPSFSGAYPFFYPPSFLLLAVPIALLPLGYAWLVWCAGTLALYITAVVGRSWRSSAAAALLVAPTTLICIVGGQSGLLMGAVMIGGLRALSTHPWLGGALLGLLTIKPQLGLLLVIALVAAGQWRAIVAACVVAVGVVLVTAMAFGWSAWVVWVQTIPFNTKLILRNRSEVIDLMPTVTAGLFRLGMPDGATQLVQFATAIAVVCVTWRAFRPGVSSTAIAVLAMSTFLATPYGFIYDMPMVTGALMLTILAREPTVAEAVLLGSIVVVPFIMLGTALPLIEPVLLGLGVALLVRRIGKECALRSTQHVPAATRNFENKDG